MRLTSVEHAVDVHSSKNLDANRMLGTERGAG
jgi:hypothetical protein